MSGQRGGGGGGRGGRGGAGRGGMTRGGTQIPMGTLTWSEFADVDKQKPSKAYPAMEEQPVLSKASGMETKSVQYQLNFLSDQKDSIWWPVEEDKKKKDMVRYSDKFNRRDDSQSFLSLRDQAFVDTLQKEAFPTGLWNTYMSEETKREEKEKKREQVKTSTRGASDWKRLLDNVENAGGDHLSEDANSEEEEEGHLDDYEDDESDDYCNNDAFDNGEDEDVDEAGEGGAEETYE